MIGKSSPHSLLPHWPVPLWGVPLLLIYLLFVCITFCDQNIIQLKYQLNSYSIADNTKWNNIGKFILNKNKILDTSNSYMEEKKKLVEKLQGGNFDYALFQLCYNPKEETCIQTYVDKSKINNAEKLLLLIGVDNNYMPYILNYRTYDEYVDEKMEVFSEMFIIEVLSVSEPIDINNVKTEDNNAKSKGKENEKDKEKGKEKPKSFIRKYWIYVAIFFLSLTLSKHVSESMQQTSSR
ncbi:hypothetical protein POVCU2_0006710 [Plasmodium ovale curtisi]|uniref:ER membrane protein complex subunit 10 n=1 Tax=Plasmodium ovale curtisi TaxID=864141 RepID=A0A1A8VM47_PLAOA|nr:hypothetical protein POVCU2_0006710 [Plasmodium ovale curtisi]